MNDLNEVLDLNLNKISIYEINEDVTILTRYLKLKKIKGFVDANSFFGLSGSEASDNCITINGVNYRINDSSLASYIGKHVIATVKIDSSKSIEEIFAIKEDENTEIVLTSDNIT